MKNIKSESGRSMVEIVGVLAVMGLITAGAFVLISSGMATQKRNTVVDDVGNIVQVYRSVFAEGKSFSNAANVQGKMGVPTTNPYDGGYTVTGNGTTLSVTVTGLPSDDCTVLSQRGWNGIKNTPACENETGGTQKLTLQYGFN